MLLHAAQPSWNTVSASLDDCLVRMPDGLRSAVLLHYLERRPVELVAEELEVDETKAVELAENGLRELRRRLTEEGVVLSLEHLSDLLLEHARVRAPASLSASLKNFIRCRAQRATYLAPESL